MKRVYAIIASLLFGVLISNAQTETLTNETIITLTKIGLQPSVIVTKIKSSNSNFDVSTDALINLNSNNVAADVIVEMMNAANKQQAAAASVMDSQDPKVMHKSGVYYYNTDKQSPLIKLQANKVNYETHSGSYGSFGGSSTTAVLYSVYSKFRVYRSQPVFYFYFEEKSTNNDWFQSSSPNEFELVKMIEHERNDTRYFSVGGSSHGMMSSSSNSGIPQKFKVQFDYSEVAPGIYKISFPSPLENEEYCFVYSGNTYKVFDFGIEK